MTDTIGVIGLGIMGTSYARLLLKGGYKVVGHDLLSANVERLTEAGGIAANSAAEVARSASIVLAALPSDKALLAACLGPQGLIDGVGPASVIVEMSTLSSEAKQQCREAFETVGATMLDAPVSGTGAQAARGEIDLLASGERSRIDELRPVFSAFSSNTHYVGPFGAGMRLKLIANLLVTIHNLAAAEALLLAERAGLDLNLVLSALQTGAGQSRMFDIRGPLMIQECYEPATARMEIHIKDINLINAFAASVQAPTPLLAASTPYYQAALAQGRNDQDTAAVFAVLKSMTARPSPI